MPNGIDTCQKPGTGPSNCGAGIPKGAQLNFTMTYASGTQWQQQIMAVEQSAWNSIGIKTALVSNTFPTVIQDYAAPCAVRIALHGRRGLVGRRLGVQPGLLPLR